MRHRPRRPRRPNRSIRHRRPRRRERLGDYASDMKLLGRPKIGLLGQPTGKLANPLAGAVIGTGVSSGTAIGIRALAPEYAPFSELIGGAAGFLTGVALILTDRKEAGYSAIAGALIANGTRALEQAFSKGELGAVILEPLNGVVMEHLAPPTKQLGAVSINEVPPAWGTIPGVYGPPMPELMGDAPVDLSAQHRLSADAINQVNSINGPSVHGMGAHYGQTILNH